MAMLDGAEWTGYKKFEAAAKGVTPTLEELKPISSPVSSVLEGTESRELKD
jgi:hypothetical protein